jgi:hypothetical protein
MEAPTNRLSSSCGFNRDETIQELLDSPCLITVPGRCNVCSSLSRGRVHECMNCDVWMTHLHTVRHRGGPALSNKYKWRENRIPSLSISLREAGSRASSMMFNVAKNACSDQRSTLRHAKQTVKSILLF